MSFNVLDLVREDREGFQRVTLGEYQGPCPGCGGTDRFCVFPGQNDKGDGRGPRGSYHCGHGKNGNGCGKAGDNIQYLRDFRSMSYKEACVHLGLEAGDRDNSSASYRAPAMPKSRQEQSFVPAAANHTDEVEDVAKWREHGEKFVARCHEVLLSREKSLQYLAGRGVTLEKIKKYRLGLHLGKTRNGEEWEPDFRPCVSWGMKGGVNPKTKKQQTFVLPAGLVIPWYGEGGLHRIRIRLAKPDPKDQKKKYHAVKGSAFSTWISRLDARAYLVEETELDAILIEEQAGDLVGVIGLGASGLKPDEIAAGALKKAIWILNALDYDKAGAKAGHWWRDAFPACRRWPVPLGKDPGEAYQQGVDIREWIKAGLPPVMLAGGDPEPIDNQEKRKASQLAVAPSKDIAALLGLLAESNGVIRIAGRGEEVSVTAGDDDWRMRHPDRARRMSDLVFTSGDVGRYLSLLPDGIFTANTLNIRSQG